MTYQTYHGSCHCGAVTFEADIDLADGTTKCNCTWCFKHRYWSLSVPPERFRVLTGAELQAGAVPAQALGVCPACSTLTYTLIPANDWNPADKVAVSVATFDDIDPGVLAEAPVTYCDGLHDNWWQPPAETRHL